MKTFKDFLISKHADQYHGTDDDMPDDFERWLYMGVEYLGLDNDDLIKYADEYAEIQKQEIVEEIERLEDNYDFNTIHASSKLDGTEHTNKDFYIQALSDILNHLKQTLNK